MNEAIRWQLISATLNGDSQRLRSLLSKQVRIDLVQVSSSIRVGSFCKFQCSVDLAAPHPPV